MNSRQLAQMGLGLIGAYTLIIALGGLTPLVFFASQAPPFSFVIAALPMALVGALSYVLEFHNGHLATVIAPDVSAATELGASDLAKTLVVLLGVLLLVQAIPGALNALLAYRAAAEFVGSSRSGLLSRFLGPGVQVAIALYLNDAA